MRMFERDPVICEKCQACLRWMLSSGGELEGHETIEMKGMDPPARIVACPRCGTDVSTTDAYACIDGFPPRFESIKKAYADFTPKWEMKRQSFEEAVHEILDGCGRRLSVIEEQVNTAEGFQWFRQRMFYRSTIAFYRCYQLFLGFLVLERRCFKTWASVTGYYSRFYFIQALLNLLMSTWVEWDKVAFVFDGRRVTCHKLGDLRKVSKRFSKGGSHEMWWSMMEAMKCPQSFPVEEWEFVLSRLSMNPVQRNNVNYSFTYLFGGFNELEWSDSGAKQMMSHFMPVPRSDRDFTDMERFFQDAAPEDGDVGDFLGDTDVQVLWCSIMAYLRLLKLLEFEQPFVKTETLVALAEMHLARDYDRVREGIALTISEVLSDNYDGRIVEELRDLWRW